MEITVGTKLEVPQNTFWGFWGANKTVILLVTVVNVHKTKLNQIIIELDKPVQTNYGAGPTLPTRFVICKEEVNKLCRLSPFMNDDWWAETDFSKVESHIENYEIEHEIPYLQQNVKYSIVSL